MGRGDVAELAHLRTLSSRCRFALGCIQVALFPPRSSRLPVAIVGAVAVATAVSAGLAVGRVVPALQVFAVTFTALLGALATLAAVRSRAPNLRVPGLTVTAAILAGLAGCVAIFAYVAVRYPTAARDPTHLLSALLSGLIGGAAGTAVRRIWTSTSRPEGRTTSPRPCR